MRLRRAPANPGAEMTILEHVAELRDRLIKSFAALLVTTLVAAFVLYDRTFSFITHSYCEIPARYRITTAAGQGCGLLRHQDHLHARVRRPHPHGPHRPRD